MKNELKKLLKASINNKEISAISILVQKSGKQVLSLNEGVNYFIEDKDLYNIKHKEIDKDSIYDLASLTKVISGFSMLCDLINQGHLDINTQIGEVFSNYSIYINNDLAKLSIYDLATHSSGLGAYIPLYTFCNTKSCIYSYIRNLKLEYKTGTQNVYSDIGYILLGEVFELVYGLKLNEIFENRIIKSLNLKDIGYLPINQDCPRKLEDFISTGYSHIREKHLVAQVHDENTYQMNGVSLHAGLFSKIGEVSNFAKCFLDTINSRSSNRIFNKELISRLIKRPSSSPWVCSWHYPSKGSSAGAYISENSIGITGFTGTSMWLDLDKDISIVVLSNRSISEHSAKFGGEKDKFSILRPNIHDIILREYI